MNAGVNENKKFKNFSPLIHSKLNMVGLISVQVHTVTAIRSFLRHDGDSYIHNMSPLLIFLICLYNVSLTV